MSRKRRLKKQRKRRAQWVGQLEDLYLRQADQAFLEAARPHLGELDATPVAELYGEVVDRALAGALTGGDPARIAELLALARRDAGSRPLVLLAEAVDLLATGRREAAAAKLAALREAGEAELGAAGHLPARLRALARPESAPAAEPERPDDASRRGIGELARLSGTLEAHAAAGKGHPEGGPTKRRLPRSLELEDPAARATWDYYRALTAVAARGFRPGAGTLAALARATAALRREAPAGGPLERLLRETDRRLRALTAVFELEQAVRRSRRPHLEELVLEKLNAAGLSPGLLRDRPPPLLRPLRQALRTRWRGLLELVFERRGAAGLGVLLAVRPELVAAELDVGAGLAEVAKWAEAKALIEAERFGELATFLSSAGARVDGAQRLAVLWSLELWARCEDARGMDLETAHETLVRLGAMAADAGRRFAAGDSLGVARFLKGELFELYGLLHLCGHFLDAAGALLAHLEDDPGLLALAHAAAVGDQDDRARHRHAARIAARGPAPADQAALLRLVENIALERPAISLPALTALEPLFTGAGWDQALERVAAAAMTEIRGGLVEAAEVASEDPEEAAWLLGGVRHGLELYRPLLGEHPEHAALEVAVESWDAAPADAGRIAGRFLGRFAGLEPALLLYRQALELREAGSHPEIDEAIVGAVVDRLDARLLLWLPTLRTLAVDATPKQRRRLASQIRKISKDETLDSDDRQMLGRLSGTIRELGWLGAAADLLSKPGTDLELPESEPAAEPRPRKRRQRRSRVDDRQLELFTAE